MPTNRPLVETLRAAMARTVANGCTADEELAAARAIARLIVRLDSAPSPSTPAQGSNWAEAERTDPAYQTALARSMAETMLKSAILELSLSHLHTLSPPGRRMDRSQRVGIHHLLDGHLGMMLPPGNTQAGRRLIAEIVDELVEDGALPLFLAMPVTAEPEE